MHYCDDFVICDCLSCNVPMVVFRYHTSSIDRNLVQDAVNKCYEVFGREVSFRWEMRTIKDHKHFHVVI